MLMNYVNYYTQLYKLIILVHFCFCITCNSILFYIICVISINLRLKLNKKPKFTVHNKYNGLKYSYLMICLILIVNCKGCVYP